MPRTMSTPTSSPVTVQRTDSGQYMLRHPSGHTVLGDDLAAAWSELEAAVAGAPAAGGRAEPPVDVAARSARPRWLLPMLVAWLATVYAVLYLADDGPAPTAAADVDALQQRIGALEAEVSRLGAALDATRAAPRSAAAPPPPPTPAPGAASDPPAAPDAAPPAR